MDSGFLPDYKVVLSRYVGDGQLMLVVLSLQHSLVRPL
jgi:hypothetical protein